MAKDDFDNIPAEEFFQAKTVDVPISPFTGMNAEQIDALIRSGRKIPVTTAKDTNPKDAVGIGKAPLSVIPQQVLFEVGLAMMEGGRKYGVANYRKAGVRNSVYYDATMRHLMSWWEGQDLDPDSGLSHVTKAITSLMVLRDAMMNDMAEDDRPIRVTNIDAKLARFNEQAKAILVKYPDCAAPFTQKAEDKND